MLWILFVNELERILYLTSVPPVPLLTFTGKNETIMVIEDLQTGRQELHNLQNTSNKTPVLKAMYLYDSLVTSGGSRVFSVGNVRVFYLTS